MFAAEVISETQTRRKTGGVIILVGGIAAGAGEAGHVEFVRTASIDERILAAVGQLHVQIADVAEVVVKSAETFYTQTEVHCEIRPYLPIILREEREVAGTVLVIVDATATKTKVRLADQQLLPIGEIVRSAPSVRIVDKEELAIKDLRKEFV